MHRKHRLWIPTFSSLFTVTLAGTSLQALFKAGVLAGSAAEAEVAVWKEGVMLQCRNQSDSCKWRAGCWIALAIVCNSWFFKCCSCQIQDLPFQALNFNAIVIAFQCDSSGLADPIWSKMSLVSLSTVPSICFIPIKCKCHDSIRTRTFHIKRRCIQHALKRR